MAEIVDGSEHPDGDLMREVYAHFGLCLYLSQVFETGLINILTAIETSLEKHPSPQVLDDLCVRNEKLTFGNLLRNLEKNRILPIELVENARKLKTERDLLAHRYFRERDIDFMTVAGCHHMIEEPSLKRELFSELDTEVSRYQEIAFKKVGFTSESFNAAALQEERRMLDEAKTKYASPLDSRKPR